MRKLFVSTIALLCSSLCFPATPSVVQDGGSVKIVAKNGRVVNFAESGTPNPNGDGPSDMHTYRLERRFDDIGYVLVAESFYEGGENIMVNLNTGTTFEIHGNGGMNPV